MCSESLIFEWSKLLHEDHVWKIQKNPHLDWVSEKSLEVLFNSLYYLIANGTEKLSEVQDLMLEFCKMDQELKDFTKALRMVDQEVRC